MTTPFDDVRAMLANVPEADGAARAAAAARQETLLKPKGALGRLEEIALWWAGWRGEAAVEKPIVALFVAAHGVTAQGVAPYPAEITEKMVGAYEKGWGAINQIALSVGAGLQVFDLGAGAPTPDLTTDDVFTEKACVQTMAYAMESLASGPDLLAVGEMGIGNSTTAAALAHALYGGSAEDWVGAGSGADAAMRDRKCEVVEAAVKRVGTPPIAGLEAMRRLGGRELAGIAGAVLAARIQKVPVLLDGYAATIAAACLEAEREGALDHALAAHLSREPGHAKVLAQIGKRPLLALDMAMGEGTGAALAIPIVRAAVAAQIGMGRLSDIGVGAS